MNKKWVATILLIPLVIILAGRSQSTFPASPEKHRISLETIGVAFDLPKGYSILQRELFEGRYATIISFGKEYRPSHFKIVDLQLAFWPTAHDGTRSVPGYKPSQYVDVEFEHVKEGHRQGLPGYDYDPEYVKLFGNKAVRYTYVGFLCCGIVVGYLRANQLSERAAK